MDIDLRDLELVAALEEHGTLTAVATHLFVSQPALSQRLMRLEERLGASLFDRRGRALVPTAAGRRMFVSARKTLEELRAAQLEVRELASGRRTPLRLSTQCATNYEWLPDALRQFRDVVPGGDVMVVNLDDTETVSALLHEEIDVALVTKLDPQMDQVRLQRLFDDELIAVASRHHPWHQKDYVEGGDFDGIHLVLFESYDQSRSPVVPLPLPPGAHPGRLTTMSSSAELLIEMVAGGEAVTVLPNWVAAPYLASGDYVGVQVGSAPQARTWYCATRHGSTSEPLQAFTQVLLDRFAGGSTRPVPRPRPAVAPAG